MRTRMRLLAAVALTIGLVAVARPAVAAPIPAGKIGIGDSVMLGAKPQLLARHFNHVDAVVSRQFSAAASVIIHWRNEGLLPHIVVVHLGTNGSITATECDAAVRAVRARAIYLVTDKVPRRYRNANNATLKACVGRHANAHLIDWFAYSHLHPGWFYSDGYHLTPSGRIAYAKFIASHSG
jgi:hypothetical protein